MSGGLEKCIHFLGRNYLLETDDLGDANLG
jgi:hypothetical protein